MLVLLPLQVTFRSQVYTSVSGSFRVGPAEQPWPVTTIILIVVTSTVVVVLLVIITSAVICCCRRVVGKRPASSKNKVSNSSDEMELQPQSGNIMEFTEDPGIIYYRVRLIDCMRCACAISCV